MDTFGRPTHTHADQPHLIGRKNITFRSRPLRNGPTSLQPTFNFFSIDAADTILLSSYRFFLAQNPPFYSAYRNNRIQQGFQRRFSFISKNVSRLLPAIFCVLLATKSIVVDDRPNGRNGSESAAWTLSNAYFLFTCCINIPFEVQRHPCRRLSRPRQKRKHFNFDITAINVDGTF